MSNVPWGTHTKYAEHHAYYLQHKERFRKYYEEHKDRISAQAREWREKNGDRARTLQREWKRRVRYGLTRRREVVNMVNDYKEGTACSDCGGLYPAVVMDFDHRPDEEKLTDISRLTRTGAPLDRVLKEIDKCDLVCANCHRVRTEMKRLGLGVCKRKEGEV